MKRKSALFSLGFVLSVFFSSWAYAQSCPDVVGVWDATGEQVSAHWLYPDFEFSFNYNPLSGKLDIVEQNGCLFHGSLDLGSLSGLPVVGTMTGRIIKMVSGDVVINALLLGYDRGTRLFSRMNITACDTIDDWNEEPGDEYMSCVKGTAVRR